MTLRRLDRLKRLLELSDRQMRMQELVIVELRRQLDWIRQEKIQLERSRQELNDSVGGGAAGPVANPVQTLDYIRHLDQAISETGERLDEQHGSWTHAMHRLAEHRRKKESLDLLCQKIASGLQQESDRNDAVESLDRILTQGISFDELRAQGASE